MTNEEAIKCLEGFNLSSAKCSMAEAYEAIDMAIKALEAPPNDNWEGYSSRLWKAAYERGKAEAEHENALGKIKDKLIEEKECAYADFERYKVEYLGQDWNDVYDSLPQDDFRYGLERCIEIIDKCMAESKLDGNPIDIDKAVEHYEGTLETLKGIDLEVDG